MCRAAVLQVLPMRGSQGTLAQAVKKGHWILLDEINLAAAETLECLSGLLEGSAGSLVLLDRGDTGEDQHRPGLKTDQFGCSTNEFQHFHRISIFA